MSRCIDCRHFGMRANPVYARLGMGKCMSIDMGRATFVTAAYARECERFEAAPADVVAKRVVFLGEKNQPKVKA